LPSLLPLNLHRALSEFLDTPLPYDDVHTLRDRMWDISPTLLRLDAIESPSNPIATLGLSHMTQSLKGASDKVNAGEKLELPVKNFYMTDAISRSSVTMAQCSRGTSFNRRSPADRLESSR
jgi:NADH dehydrogenase (ubiquinone) Fe-S protein 1